MTEAEWLICRDSTRLLRHYRRTPPSDRKLRLFAVLCCYRIWAKLPDDRCRRAVEVCERFAEGSATSSELEAAHEGAEAAFNEYSGREETAAAAVSAACYPSDLLELVASTARQSAWMVWPRERRRAEHQWQCQIARDLFGNPFRSIVFSPMWRTDTVVTLARGIYESREFSAMPILSDALQDAGCGSTDVLDHCLDSGPHARGCWVIDLILGKE